MCQTLEGNQKVVQVEIDGIPEAVLLKIFEDEEFPVFPVRPRQEDSSELHSIRIFAYRWQQGVVDCRLFRESSQSFVEVDYL